MKRRINSTGRKQIKSSQISIRLVNPNEPGLLKYFEADLSALKELDGIPGDARIYVEPYAVGSSSIMRFSFGTLADIVSPTDTFLADLDAGSRVLIRIKVVDESTDVGKILASVSGLRPFDEQQSEDDQRSILPVEIPRSGRSDLGTRSQ